MQLSLPEIQHLYPRYFYYVAAAEQAASPEGEAAHSDLAAPPAAESPAPAAPPAPAEAPAPADAAQATAQADTRSAAPASASASPQPEAPSPVAWRSKSEARLTMLLPEAEYRDRSLTDLLKKIVDALGIPHEQVAFGKLSEAVRPSDLLAMPTRLGLLFGYAWAGFSENPLTIGEKMIYVVPALSEMPNDRTKKREAWNRMQTFKDQL